MPLCITCKHHLEESEFLVKCRDGIIRIHEKCYGCRTKSLYKSRLRKGRHTRRRPPINIPANMRFCHTCCVIKLLEEFYNHKKCQHGKSSICKSCKMEQDRSYRKENRERIRAYQREYRKKNKIKVDAWQSKYRATNREEIHARLAAWKANHIEKVRDWGRTSFKKRRALIRKAKHVERVSLDIIYQRDYGLCSLCHTKVRREDASLDHIIPLSKGGDHTYQNCALAHMRCNSSKGNGNKIQQMRLF